MDVSGEMLPNLHQASPSTTWPCTKDIERDVSEALASTHEDSVDGDSVPEGTSQALTLEDYEPPTDDPESPRDIVHENVLVLFPLALLFVFLLFGLVVAFSE